MEDAERYVLEVAEASPIPLGIYNNPPRVKTDLTADALIRLSTHPNIVVLKESTTRVAQIAELAAARAAGRCDMALMCCDSPNLGLVVPLMALGGQGTANMTGNIAPAELAVISSALGGEPDAEGASTDAARFREAYLRLLPLFFFTYSAVNPVPVKSLAKALGMPAGDLRRPYRGLPACGGRPRRPARARAGPGRQVRLPAGDARVGRSRAAYPWRYGRSVSSTCLRSTG